MTEGPVIPFHSNDRIQNIFLGLHYLVQGSGIFRPDWYKNTKWVGDLDGFDWTVKNNSGGTPRAHLYSVFTEVKIVEEFT